MKYLYIGGSADGHCGEAIPDQGEYTLASFLGMPLSTHAILWENSIWLERRRQRRERLRWWSDQPRFRRLYGDELNSRTVPTTAAKIVARIAARWQS